MTEQPASPEAEQVVLGSMLHIPALIGNAVARLTEDDFFVPRHRTIFSTITRLSDEGQPTSTPAVLTALRNVNELAKVGGGDYLATLHEASQPASIDYFIEQVAEAAVKRRLIAHHQRGIELVTAGSEADLGSLLAATQSDFDIVAEQRVSNGIVGIGSTLQPTIDMIEELGTTKIGTTGVSTGFIDLDRLTSGLHGGQMIVVAARPAVGKSTLGLDFSRSAAIRHGQATCIFSLEMSREEITMRMLSAECNINLGKMRAGDLSDEDWNRISQAMPRIADAPLFMDDTANITMTEIRAKARKLKQKHDLKLIVIDYLQLMQGDRRTDSRQQEVSEISRSIKLLAKELNVPIVAMSQLNRNSENRGDKRPAVSDLRESGSIEQDADVIILMYRDDLADPDSVRVGECDLIVAKQRNGPTGIIPVAAQLHHSRFVDMAHEH